jgi:ferredoxin
MPKLKFSPKDAQAVEAVVEPNTKILAAANRLKVPIRFGCASCRCGTCGVAVAGGTLSPMRSDERALLERMGLTSDGSVRLACQARVVDGEVAVDLAFQDTYSPDQGELDEEDEDEDGDDDADDEDDDE